MKVSFNNEDYNVIVIKKKIKNIYFRINDNLDIQVSCPRFAINSEILEIVKKNEKAILRLINLKKRELENDKYFYYLGNKYNIIYDDNYKVPYFENDLVYIINDENLNKFYLNEVKKLFTKRVEALKNDFDNLPEFTLKFRKMKTRWGVCNYGKNIVTLNTELLKKDMTLLDYVIIHELCHFYHHDHSTYFWNEVQKHYPYYKMARKMLRD